MWSPTHIQVTVQRAKNLLLKGRGGTNDVFVVIQLGKEKYQTSVKEKCVDPEWYEECDLAFQNAETYVVLTVLHRNLLGLDEFLGQITIPIQHQQEFYDRPVNKWYALKSKNLKKEEKYRGELEVQLAFVVRSSDTQSLNDFSVSKKKRRNSLKAIATSVGHKIQKMPSRTFSLRSADFDPRARLASLKEKRNSVVGTMTRRNSENGFDSEIYENDQFDSMYELEDKQPPLRPARKMSSLYVTQSIKEEETYSPEAQSMKIVEHGEWTNRILSRMKDLTRSEMNLSDVRQNEKIREKKGALQTFRNTLRRHTLQLSENPDLSSLKLNLNLKKSFIDQKLPSNISKDDSVLPEDISTELYKEYSKMSHQDLAILVIKQQADLEKQRDKISDLEDYLDNLLVRVMETTPRILQKPYKHLNPACSR